MTERAAIVTGASSGIGLAIADMLGDEGYRLTLAARRPDKLEAAADGLRAKGHEVQTVAGGLGDEAVVVRVVAAHRERYGRCDVLVNNAGMGVFEPAGRLTEKAIDRQIGVNLEAPAFFYRECLDMLEAAAEECGQAIVVNLSSMTAVHGEAGLSIYAAAKAAIIGFSDAMHLELSRRGIKSTVFMPGFVDTPMADGVKGDLASEDMIEPHDLALAVRFLTRLSHATVVPELLFVRPSEAH